MEDATKEFQVFLSPIRDYQPQGKESSAIKHRIVPVINKIFANTSSTFTINQRKSSVYKAVSGVAFQDTDVKGKNKKADRKKDRRKSFASTTINSDKSIASTDNSSQTTGTRRSKSMSSVESSRTLKSEVNFKTKEIIHPFAPVILHNQSSGRKSRYSRIKERRRSCSQARYKTEYIKYENGNLVLENSTPPVRPRRTRSASRPRQSLALAPFAEDNELTQTVQERNELRYDRKLSTPISIIETQTNNPTYQSPSNISAIKKLSKSIEKLNNSICNNGFREFSQIYTHPKRNTLEKKKEEPEGGYFSLEREEDFNELIEDGEHFQRENSSECIYIAQGIKTNDNDIYSSRNDQYLVEEIYAEVPLSSESTEVGYIDDEGLYEEIFIPKNEENSDSKSESFLGESKINIQVSVNTTEPFSTSTSVSNLVEKNSSTVVYINGDEKSSSTSMNPSANLWKTKQEDNKSKSVFYINILNDPSTSDIQSSTNSWCACKNSNYSYVNHNSSCLKSMSGLRCTKHSMINKDSPNNNDAKPLGAQAINEALYSTQQESAESSYSSINVPYKSSVNAEHDLSDIDLDMFAPKGMMDPPKLPVNIRIKPNPQKSLNGLLYEPRLNLQPYGLNRSQFHYFGEITESRKTGNHQLYHSTFKSVLQNSIFNQPESEILEDEEGLVIRDGQTITCITDSSSDDSSDEDITPDHQSLWKQAKKDFEFVKVNEGLYSKPPIVKRSRSRRRTKSPIRSINSQSNITNNINSKICVNPIFEDIDLEPCRAPERPSRRRNRNPIVIPRQSLLNS